MTALVTRAQWGARPRKSGTTSINPKEGVTVHYVGGGWAAPWSHSTCDDKVRAIQADHMDSRGWSDIAYNYLACPHDYLYEGRGYDRRSSANGPDAANAVSFAVCALWGENSGRPPGDLHRSIRSGIDVLRTKGGASTKLHGHRDWKATECPGDYLYNWVKLGAPIPAVNPPTNEDALNMALSQEAKNDIFEIVHERVEAFANRNLRYMLQTEDERAIARKRFDEAIKSGKTELEAGREMASYLQNLIDNLK